MAQLSSFDNYLKRDNRRKRRNRNRHKDSIKIDKCPIEFIQIKNPYITSTYVDGDQIRKLFNDTIRADGIAIKAKRTYEQLKVEFSKLDDILSVEKAPISNMIEDFQLAIIEAEKQMLKTTLDATICTDKLNEARKLEKNQSYVDCFNCHELEETLFS